MNVYARSTLLCLVFGASLFVLHEVGHPAVQTLCFVLALCSGLALVLVGLGFDMPNDRKNR